MEILKRSIAVPFSASLCLLSSTALASVGFVPRLEAPPAIAKDANGVDLTSGMVIFPGPTIGIGNGESQLVDSVAGLNSPDGSTYAGGINHGPYSLCPDMGPFCAYSGEMGGGWVVVPSGSREFNFVGGQYVPLIANGDNLRQVGSIFYLTTSDGTRYTIDGNIRSDTGDAAFPRGLLTRVDKPNGESIRINQGIGYEAASDRFGSSSTEAVHINIILGVTSNYGWRLQSDSDAIDYSLDPGYTPNRLRLRHTVAFNMSVYNCQEPRCNPASIPFPKTYYKLTSDLETPVGSTTTNWVNSYAFYSRQDYRTSKSYSFYDEVSGGPSTVSYGSKGDITYSKRTEFTQHDPYDDGEMHQSWSTNWSERANLSYRGVNTIFRYRRETQSVCIPTIPPKDDTFHTREHTCVYSVEKGGQTWLYDYTVVDAPTLTYKTTVTNPDGSKREIVSAPTVASVRVRVVKSVKDELNRTTVYDHDNYGRVIRVTQADGSYTSYEYDGRGNVTWVRQFSASHAAGPAQSAGIPSYCDESASNVYNYKVCNKPQWVRDAKGNQTDYTYSYLHGGVITETGPADANGVRPQTRYEYTPLYAKIKDANGNLVNAEAPIYKLTKISSCAQAVAGNPASCLGGVNEQIKEFNYSFNNNNNYNLMLTSETIRNGNNSLSQTTSYFYDTSGNVVSVDGPRTDVDDRSYTTYDILRRKVFEVGPDPDGTGPLKRQTIKHIYDDYGRETRTETGSGYNIDGSDFAWATARKMTYRINDGVLIKTEVVVP